MTGLGIGPYEICLNDDKHARCSSHTECNKTYDIKLMSI